MWKVGATDRCERLGSPFLSRKCSANGARSVGRADNSIEASGVHALEHAVEVRGRVGQHVVGRPPLRIYGLGSQTGV